MLQLLGILLYTKQKEICKQIYEGPKNIIVLILKKIIGEKILINEILKKQKQIDKQIEKEYSEFEYTWRYPYIKVNPYGITPLSALIKFKTDEPEKVKIEIVDREGTNIVYNFDRYMTEHEYGISGLYSKGITEIKLILENKKGKIKNKNIKLNYQEFKSVNNEKIFVLKNNIKETNLYLLRGYNNGIIIDNFGNIRGIRKNYYFEAHGHIILKNNNYLNSYSDKVLIEENEVGKILKVYNLEKYSYHHHALELDNGNILLAVDKEGVNKIDYNSQIIETVEDHIIEIDRETGKIIKEWDIGNILNVNREYQSHGRGSDWFHMNSFIYDKNDKSLIISGNFQGIIKIDYETGELKWIMAYHKEWEKSGREGKGKELSKYLLYASDKNGERYSNDIQSGDRKIENFEFPVGQHDLSWIGENQIMMFNNREIGRPVYKNEKYKYSEVVVYKVDEKNMNVSQLWEYGKEQKEEMYSPWVSSAEEKDGDILIGAGAIVDKNNENYGRILVINKDTLKIKLEIIYFPNYTTGGNLGGISFYQVNRLK